MEGRSTDLGERVGRREIAGALRSKKKRMCKTLAKCNEEIQNLRNKPRRNEELKKSEEALPRLKGGDLEKASRLFKSSSGIDRRDERRNRGEMEEQQACTTMFFLIPKNVTSERPIALLPTLVRWWEA